MPLNCGAGEDLRILPWTVRSNQSILKEISPEFSLEGLMLKLKLWYFGHLMCRADSLEKNLMLGKNEGRRRRGRQRTGYLDSIINSMDMRLSKLLEMVKDREAWHAAVLRVAKSQTGLSDWTTILIIFSLHFALALVCCYLISDLRWKVRLSLFRLCYLFFLLMQNLHNIKLTI